VLPSIQFRFACLIGAVLSVSACSSVTGPEQAALRASSPYPSVSVFVPPAAPVAPPASAYAPIAVSAPATPDVLFGSREIAFSPNLAAFERWQDVKTRFANQRNLKSSCDGSDAKTCPVQWWQNFVAELSTLPLKDRIARVNDTFNRVTYVSATANWHNPGYWETPFEFLAKGGQCQDYAIAKYLALLDSGVPEEQMRFVVLRYIARGLDHAVTVVNVGGEEMVLDNLAAEIKPADENEGYAPYYALNDRGWWLYAPTLNYRASAVQVAAVPPKAD
jgi:predicted transglutaminase-like cysteine proteinase